MNGYKITIWADKNHSEVIMEAELPQHMFYYANTIYNTLFSHYDNMMMERIETVSTVYSIKIDGKTRKD